MAGIGLPVEPSRGAVEDFILHMAPWFIQDCGFVAVQPWMSKEPPPTNALVPNAGAREFAGGDLQGLAKRFSAVLVPCTFETQQEQEAVSRLLEQLDESLDEALFLVQLTSSKRPLSREAARSMVERHDEILSALGGRGGVLLDPEGCPETLRRAVSQETEAIKANRERSALLEQCSTQGAQLLGELASRHRKLLWENIPQELMKDFAPLDADLLETTKQVGRLQLLQLYRTRQRKVIVARPEGQGQGQQRVVVKVFEKSECPLPTDVERIYREFRFQRDYQHPHIARCLEMLHSTSRVYLVIQFGGLAHLATVLKEHPGQRLHADDALDCTRQIAGALALCHSREIVHRQVSLEHIAVEERDDTFFCRLVDFGQAIHTGQAKHSQTCCGFLPFMAPEMALVVPYVVMPVDSWSLGMVLLEAAGGLGCAQAAVGWGDDVELQVAARQISVFFGQEASHTLALTSKGAEQDVFVLDALRALVVVEASQRSPMSALLV